MASGVCLNIVLFRTPQGGLQCSQSMFSGWAFRNPVVPSQGGIWATGTAEDTAVPCHSTVTQPSSSGWAQITRIARLGPDLHSSFGGLHLLPSAVWVLTACMCHRGNKYLHELFLPSENKARTAHHLIPSRANLPVHWQAEIWPWHTQIPWDNCTKAVPGHCWSPCWGHTGLYFSRGHKASSRVCDNVVWPQM